MTKSVVGNTTQGTTNLPAFLEINGTEARRSAKDPPDDADAHADNGDGGSSAGVGITEEKSGSKKTKEEIQRLQKELSVVTQKLAELEAAHDREEAKLEQEKLEAQKEAEIAAKQQKEAQQKVEDELKDVEVGSERVQSLDEKMTELTETLKKITGDLEILQQEEIKAGEEVKKTTAEKGAILCDERHKSDHFWAKILHNSKEIFKPQHKKTDAPKDDCTEEDYRKYKEAKAKAKADNET